MSKKYELTNDTVKHNGHTLYRIKALRDIPRHNVKAGYLGGYIEKEDNLSHYGGCWVDDDAKVWGSAKVCGNAWVSDNAKVSDNAEVFGNARVSGNAKVCGYAQVYGNAHVYRYACVAGSAEVYDNAKVFCDARVCDNAEVFGNAKVFGHAYIEGRSCLIDGVTTKQSYQLTLPEHDIAICSPTEVRVNGLTKTIDEWINDPNTLCYHRDIKPSKTLYKHLLYLKQNWSDLAPKPHDDEHNEQEPPLMYGILDKTDEGWHNLPDDKAYPILMTTHDNRETVIVKERFRLQWVYECGHKEPINEGDKWYSLEYASNLIMPEQPQS